jgi:hypothetical protein
MKYASVIIGVICLILIIKSFVSESFTPRFLNFEINVWLYRTIWSGVAIFSFYDFYRKTKKENLKR